jgi:hypothetical protein
MKIKNNIILKNNGSLMSGSGLHKHGLLIDIRHHLSNQHDKTIVNNPTFGSVLGSKAGTDAVKIGSINNDSSSHDSTHALLEDSFKKISFKDKKKKNIKLEL